MNLNEVELRKQYQQFSDEHIEYLACYESPYHRLPNEESAIAKEEIERRGLPEKFQTAADILIRGVSEEELEEIHGIEYLQFIPFWYTPLKDKREKAEKLPTPSFLNR